MTLKYLKSLSLVFTLLAFAACSSSDGATGSTGDGALTTAEEAQVEAAASTLTQSLVTSTSSFAGGSVGFQASESCMSFEYSSSGSVEDTELDANTYRTTFTDYGLESTTCTESDGAGGFVCVESCSEEFISSFSFFFDGEIEMTFEETSESEGSFEFVYNNLVMEMNFGDESFSSSFDGGFAGTYTDTEMSATYTDFSMEIESSTEESAALTVDGSLTYNLVSTTLNGTVTFVINGDTATCTFVDYIAGSSTAGLCTV